VERRALLQSRNRYRGLLPTAAVILFALLTVWLVLVAVSFSGGY
jgi:hypothetical protein